MENKTLQHTAYYLQPPISPSVSLGPITKQHPHFACNLRVELDVVGREVARCTLVMSKPPVLVGEFQVGNLGTLGEAQFWSYC